LSRNRGELQSFTFVVQSGTRAICETACDNGDADLYLRWNAEPDFDMFLYDCVSAGTGSIESCAVEDPGLATVLWVTIVPHISFTDATITCRSLPTVSPIALTDASSSSPLSLSTGLSQTFVLNVQSLSSTVVCETLCDNGDADIYVSVDAEADISSGLYDCSSTGSTSVEECIVSDLEEVTLLFVTVSAFVSFEDLALTCFSITEIVELRPMLDLADGVQSESFALLTNQVQELSLQTDPSSDAACTIFGDNGDADLFVRWDTAPNIDLFLFDCVSNDALSNETCRVVNPGNATAVWASVFAFSSFDDLTVTCTSTQAADATLPPTQAPTLVAPEPDVTPLPTRSPSSKPTSSPTTGGGAPSGATPVSFILSLVLTGSLLPLWW
jgi:hypothetical protein